MNNEKVTWKDRVFNIGLFAIGLLAVKLFGVLGVLIGFGAVYVAITLYDKLKK